MILMYHHVCPPEAVPSVKAPLEGWQYCLSPKEFRHQLTVLQRSGWKFVSLADYVGTLSQSPIRWPIASVTFDDGWMDNYDYAFPILSELQIPSTVFVVSGEMAGVPKDRRMSPIHLRELHGIGVEIGAHSQSHPNLTRLTAEELHKELYGSRCDLEAVVGRSVRFLAYPGGRFNKAVVESAQATGYEAACSVIGMGCNSQKSRFWLYRDVFSDRMAGWRDWIRRTPTCRRLLHGRAEQRAQKMLTAEE